MAEKLTIANWAEEDKPREKLERLGALSIIQCRTLRYSDWFGIY